MALSELYQKYNYSPSQAVALIPQHVLKSFDPCAALFVPQRVRNTMNAAVPLFKPQAVLQVSKPRGAAFAAQFAHTTTQINEESTTSTVRSALNPRAAAFVLVARSILNTDAEMSMPASTSSTAQQINATLRQQHVQGFLDPCAPEFVPVNPRKLNVHAVTFVPTSASISNRAAGGAFFPEPAPSSCTRPNATIEAFTFNMHAYVFTPKLRADEQDNKSAVGHAAYSQPSSRIASISSAPETIITDLSNESMLDVEETDDSSLDFVLEDTLQSQFEETGRAKDQYMLKDNDFCALKDVIELSLVHYKDPASLARVNLTLTRGPAAEVRVVLTVSVDACLSIFMLHPWPSIDAFALSSVKVSCALPLLIAFRQRLLDLAFIAKLSATSKATQGRATRPWELGFGPSFRQGVADTIAELRDLSSSASSPIHSGIMPAAPHHWSYLGHPVSHANDTDPAVSLAVIVGRPKGVMSNLAADTNLRVHTIIWQAFMLVDPIILCGSFNEFVGMSVSQIRAAVVGRVWRYLQLGGTWSTVDYPEECVYADQNLTGTLPPVFTEYNDCGFRKWSDTILSFRERFEIAHLREEAERKELVNKKRNPGLLGYQSWSPPGLSPLMRVQLASDLPPSKLVDLDRMLQPTKKPWADLDEEEEELWNGNIVEADLNGEEGQSEGQVTDDGDTSETLSLQSQIALSEDEKGLLIVDGNSSTYSSDEEGVCMPIVNFYDTDQADVDCQTRSQEKDLLHRRGAIHPRADDEFLVYDLDGDSSEDEESSTATDEEVSPVSARHAQRSFSNPSPEAGRVLHRSSYCSRTVSAPSRLFSMRSSKLADRRRAGLPRSLAIWDLKDVPVKPFSRLSETSLSPVMKSSIAEDDEEDFGDADIEDNDEDQSTLSEINQTYREANGIPEPGTLSLRQDCGAGDHEFVYKTPTSLAKYLRRKSEVKVLPTILSGPDDTDDDQGLIAGISYTPPSSTESGTSETIESPVSGLSSSVGDGAAFDSSPPDTPTRMTRPGSETLLQTAVGASLLEDINTLPISAFTSSVRQPIFSFSGIITLAVIEADATTFTKEAVDHGPEEDSLLQQEFAIFLPPTMLQEPELPAPLVDMTPAHGHNSINKFPEIKKTWTLIKLKSVLSKSKEERTVLKKKHDRKVSDTTVMSGSTKASSTMDDANTKKEGFWGSVKSKVGSTMRRR